MPIPAAGDEARHIGGPELLWNESYYLDWFTADGKLGGYVRVGFYPNLNTVWYWACLVGEGRPLVTVVEHEIAMPTSSSSLELRGDGVWADHCIETPLDHMSINVEAFGLAVDDPTDMYSNPVGERVAFGFELDFITDRAGYLWPPVTPRYEIPCKVEGIVMVGDERIEIDGWGQRDHSWGASRDWWTNTWSWNAGRLGDGTRFHGAGAFLEGSDWGVSYVLDPGSSEFREDESVNIEAKLGREGLAESARLGFGGLDLSVDPLYWSPVLLTAPDGRLARFPRALARFTDAERGEGFGWIEWNQPPPA